MWQLLKYGLLAFICSFIAVLTLAGLYFLLPEYLAVKLFGRSSHLIKINPSLLPSPLIKPSPGLTPATIIIPSLDINTAVESVGLTSTNNMDVPKNAASVGWYMYGPKPGEIGNSVIAGHFDTPAGKPAVFYNLNQLKIGDEVVVISENAVRTSFIVTGKDKIPYDQFPKEEFFNTQKGRNLNLITCGGIWDNQKKIYADRFVVYTTFKQSQL